jgi:hypothetical protein
MRKRIKTNSVTVVIEQVAKEERDKQIQFNKNFGEVVKDIMQEVQCSWTEAKRIYKFRRVERAIARELQKI